MRCKRAARPGAPEPAGTLNSATAGASRPGAHSQSHFPGTKSPRPLGRVPARACVTRKARAGRNLTDPAAGDATKTLRVSESGHGRRVGGRGVIQAIFPGACVLAAYSAPDQALCWPPSGAGGGKSHQCHREYRIRSQQVHRAGACIHGPVLRMAVLLAGYGVDGRGFLLAMSLYAAAPGGVLYGQRHRWCCSSSPLARAASLFWT